MAEGLDVNHGQEFWSSSEDYTSDTELFMDTIINEEGKIESVLTPGKATETQSLSLDSGHGKRCAGEGGYLTLLLSCMSSLLEERIIQSSPRGKIAGLLLQYIQDKRTEQHEWMITLSQWLVARVQTCLEHGYACQLPSNITSEIWKRYHELRCRKDVICTWSSYLSALNVPDECLEESELTLQLLMDRIIEKLLERKANSQASNTITPPSVPLRIGEENAIRYMAGYVAVKLFRRYKKSVKQPYLQTKYDMFAHVLEGMEATDQPDVEQVDSLSDYTTLWSELIDRGGLYHISDKVFQLFKEIEIVVRSSLNVPNMKSYSLENRDICSEIIGDAVKAVPVLRVWESIASSIPPEYETYSVELLEKVVSLWVNTRVHAFAEAWTMKFQRKYKKGTRKSLKPKKSEE